MKKSLISIVVVLAMLLSMTCGVFADDTLSSYLAQTYGNGSVPTRSVNVGVNMQGKKSADANYSDETVVVYKSNSSAVESFDFTADLSMDAVKEKFNSYIDKAALDAKVSPHLENQKVRGEFTVTITYPAELEIPEEFKTGGNMEGFNEDAKRAFEEVGTRDSSQAGKLVIKIRVKNPDNAAEKFITKAQLSDTTKNYLADMTLTCKGVTTTALTGNTPYYIYGALSGTTTIFDDNGDNGIINYNGVQQDTVNAPIDPVKLYIYRKTSGGGGPSSGAESIPKTKVVVMFDVSGDTTVIEGMEVDRNTVINLDDIEKPAKDGYIFDGFYENRTFTKQLSGEYKVTKDTVLYARWLEEDIPSVFSDEHLAYIKGYPNETVRPLNTITREEVTIILYRLLASDAKTKIHSTTNSFKDVEGARWSNEAISSMTNGGYIKGYPDGTFKPENCITRAEFATLISRFTEARSTNADYYKDIYDHWAKDYIQTAADKGWLEGYEDGTFRPNQYITRADVIAIMNNMLNRHVDAKGLSADARQWIDNPSSSAYYFDILEATNSHNFERSSGVLMENWTEIISKTLTE